MPSIGLEDAIFSQWSMVDVRSAVGLKTLLGENLVAPLREGSSKTSRGPEYNNLKKCRLVKCSPSIHHHSLKKKRNVGCLL